jgi:hypothetical protein
MTAAKTLETSRTSKSVKTFRAVLGALGVGVLGYGVSGLLTEPAIRDPADVGKWLVTGLLGHDALLAPFVFLLCAGGYRFTGARWRGRLAGLLLVGGSLIVISVPALLQQGRNPNKTVLPLDYARNLGALLLLLVAAVALYGGADAARRRRREGRHEDQDQHEDPDQDQHEDQDEDRQQDEPEDEPGGRIGDEEVEQT